MVNQQAENAAPQPASVQPSEAAPATPASAASNPPLSFKPAELDAALYPEPTPATPAASQAATETQSTPAETPAAETPAEAAPETPAGDTPQAEGEVVTSTEAPAETATPEDTPEGEKPFAKRISTAQFDDEEKRALDIKKKYADAGEKISLREAYDILDRQQKKQAPEAAPEATEPSATADPIASLEQEVANLEAQLTQAGEEGSILTADLAKLQIEHGRKTAALEVAKMRAEQDAEANRATAKATLEKAKAKVVDDYPNLADADSHLGAAVAAEIRAMQNPAHPDHHELSNPETAPKFVADSVLARLGPKVAREQGIPLDQAIAQLTGKKAGAPAPKSTVTPPATAPKPLPPAAGKVNVAAPGSAAVAPAAPTPTAKDLLAQSWTKPSVLDDALGYDGNTLVLGR